MKTFDYTFIVMIDMRSKLFDRKLVIRNVITFVICFLSVFRDAKTYRSEMDVLFQLRNAAAHW